MKRNSSMYGINGTSALKPVHQQGESPRVQSSSFAAKPGGAVRSNVRYQPRSASQPKSTNKRLFDIAKDIFERSEMACSLLLEDHRGVPYGAFSHLNIATLSIASTAIAIVSIAVGS